ncbi:MAG: hypothetical protein KY429_12045 [Actinobacteria bacterium]|nr:hypothetical protein [Actinomycetota bacterium]
MPDTVKDAPPISAEGFWNGLRQSLRAHVDRPILLVFVFGLTIAVFILDHLTGSVAPGPRDLAKSFAIPPLDVYSDLRLLRDTGARWAILVALPIRVALMAAYFVVLLQIGPLRNRLIGFAAVYFAGLISFAIPFAMSALYVRQYISTTSSGQMTGWPMLLLLLLGPIVHAVLALIFVQVAVLVLTGQKIRVRFSDGRLWVIALASSWIWFSVAGKAGDLFKEFPVLSFSIAFAALVAQAVLLGAAAYRAQIGSGHDRRDNQGTGPGGEFRHDLDFSSERAHSNQRDVG